MAHAEFNVVSSQPCENTPRRRDGGYVCNIHHLAGSGIKRTRLQMGNTNPMDESMVDLAAELRKRISAEYKFIESADKVRLESFVGLSVVRVCVRDEHDDVRCNPTRQLSPRAERVAAIAFVKNPEDMVEIQQHATVQQRAVSENGLGSARWAGGPLSRVLHLPITLAERDYPIEFAVPALPGSGRAADPYVALHTVPSTGDFIEQLVTREQLS